MYARKNNTLLPGLFLGLGILGMLLRSGLYAWGMDQRDLLVSGHPLAVALWLLTAAAVVLTVFFTRSFSTEEAYGKCFPPSPAAFAGQLLGAAGIGATVLLNGPQMPGPLGSLWLALGYASVPCMLAAAFARMRRKDPFFLLSLVPCLFLVLHIVNHYQTWSSDPQAQDYLFQLLGAVSLMLFSFYCGAWNAGIRRVRLLAAMALAAVFFTLTAIPQCSYPWLYLGGCAWAVTGASVQLPPQRQREVPL